MKKQRFNFDYANKILLHTTCEPFLKENRIIDYVLLEIVIYNFIQAIHNRQRSSLTFESLHKSQCFLYALKYLNFNKCRSPPFYKSSIQKTYKMEEI